MRFGLFYEHQLPRPWEADSERRLMADALDQLELADRLGFDCAWAVEHHFLEEYSHSSAPEVFLAAASQRTRHMRLGHGVIQLPPAVNHPARVAERVATLDLISGGRVEFGTGESSSASELGGFGVERTHKREQWSDALDAVTRMFVEQPFAGWSSPWLRMPPRNVVPKPLQKPHPPLWVACSRRETIHLAARNGIGALSFSFVEPEDAARWVREYYDILSGPECRPAGFAVNPNVAVVLPMMCHRDERAALERGMSGAQFFAHSLAHYYGMSPHEPGRTDLSRAFAAQRDSMRSAGAGAPVPLGVRLVQDATGSARGAIGTPEQVRELLERYEAAGVDQVIFVLQAGANRHEHICESLELFAQEVLPGFAERRVAREAAKARRLGPAVAAALDRREPARAAADGYRVDEPAELARARPPGRRPPPRSALAAHGRRLARRSARDGATALLRRIVAGCDDAQLERRFASKSVQRAMLSALAGSFRPGAAHGFEGDIAIELTAVPQSRPWTLRIGDRRARVVPGPSAQPAVALRVPLALFVRVAAGDLAPAALAMSASVQAEGDLSLVNRLSEMFGGRSPY